MQPEASTDETAPAQPWSEWTMRGGWAKLAFVLAGLSLLSSVIALFTTDGVYVASVAYQIRTGAAALGSATPYLVLTSILVEPARFRGWSFAALVTWAVASGVLALGNLHAMVEMVATSRG